MESFPRWLSAVRVAPVLHVDEDSVVQVHWLARTLRKVLLRILNIGSVQRVGAESFARTRGSWRNESFRGISKEHRGKEKRHSDQEIVNCCVRVSKACS